MTDFQLSWDRAPCVREIYFSPFKGEILHARNQTNSCGYPYAFFNYGTKRVKLTAKFHRQRRLTFWRILTCERDGQHK